MPQEVSVDAARDGNRCEGGRLGPIVAAVCAALLCGNSHAVFAQAPRAPAVSIAPALIRPGDVVRVAVRGAADDRISATVFGQPLSFAFDEAPREWTALAGVDLDVKPGRYQLRVQRNGAAAGSRTMRVVARRFAARRLRVSAGFVDPPPETLAQILMDGKALAEVYARSTPQQWTGAFVPPVDGRPTSNFGTRSYYNGRLRSPHAGVDFTSKTGTPVSAANHGTIALADPLYFTGNTVIVDHGARLFSVFAHLSAIHVKTGDIVSPDTIIGLVGATGRVTGPHLHWSVRLNDARVDPLSLIAATRPGGTGATGAMGATGATGAMGATDATGATGAMGARRKAAEHERAGVARER